MGSIRLALAQEKLVTSELVVLSLLEVSVINGPEIRGAMNAPNAKAKCKNCIHGPDCSPHILIRTAVIRQVYIPDGGKYLQSHASSS